MCWEWFSEADHRDRSFEALEHWLRDEAPSKSRQFVPLKSVRPVTVADVCLAELEMSVELPWDLRRLLLEFGDVGQAFFADSLLTKRRYTSGMWKWSSQREFNSLEVRAE